MKLSGLFVTIAAVAHAEDGDRKVPPRHPLQRLNRLVEFAHENLDMWFHFLPSQEVWKTKFQINAERMERNFNRDNQRCGFYDEHQLPHGGPKDRRRRDVDFLDDLRYNREDPAEGTKQITTGFRKWAERYISTCSGQRLYKHQVNRMNKWNALLQAHLASQED